MRFFTISLVVLVFIGGCAQFTSDSEVIASRVAESIPDDFDRSLIFGTWYGKQPLKSGGYREQISKNFKDGTYEYTFKVTDPSNEAETTVEVGQWGLSGNVYFTVFRGWVDNGSFKPSNPEVSTNYDAYEVIEIDRDRFTYKHFRTGNEYTILRVKDGYHFSK